MAKGGGSMKPHVKKKTKAWKSVPDMWWDFNNDTTAIIVECSHPRYPIIVTIPFQTKRQKNLPSSEEAIKQAENIMSDIQTGRKSYKNYVFMSTKPGNYIFR